MPSDARIFLSEIRPQHWFETVPARVSFSLLLLVFLAIPTFLLLVNDARLLLYYSIYPLTALFSVYLRYKGREYLSSLVMVLSVYGVVLWMCWLIGFAQVNELKLWIIALLPWVMFGESHRLSLAVLSLVPVTFSLTLRFLPEIHSPLFPAEREFVAQMLKISVGMGAFSCVYYLRQQFTTAEKKRILENEFYSNTLNNIPLPIIIKDGITLDYIFYNSAAALTFDLKPGYRHSNQTTFSETCAAAVSRIDHDVLRSVTYHIESDENLVHQTGLTWHFRTYRIPLELRSSGRRLLITVSEDLRAINILLRKAEETHSTLASIVSLVSPLLIRFDRRGQKVHTVQSGTGDLPSDILAYLEFFFSRNQAQATGGQHSFELGNQRFLLCYGPVPRQEDLHGVVIALAG
ncbi:MAG TPA: hypothetical protein PKM44_04290 [Turneriella sp.]|nr:hypothetical protein [Turneriella sp.]HNE19687.1 hypothetical protein [Turneriella sp.]HNL09705.1 hypothetical protein [Turneriella sp.]